MTNQDQEEGDQNCGRCGFPLVDYSGEGVFYYKWGKLEGLHKCPFPLDVTIEKEEEEQKEEQEDDKKT